MKIIGNLMIVTGGIFLAGMAAAYTPIGSAAILLISVGVYLLNA